MGGIIRPGRLASCPSYDPHRPERGQHCPKMDGLYSTFRFASRLVLSFQRIVARYLAGPAPDRYGYCKTRAYAPKAPPENHRIGGRRRAWAEQRSDAETRSPRSIAARSGSTSKRVQRQVGDRSLIPSQAIYSANSCGNRGDRRRTMSAGSQVKADDSVEMSNPQVSRPRCQASGDRSSS
jgi:hypothetical protein